MSCLNEDFEIEIIGTDERLLENSEYFQTKQDFNNVCKILIDFYFKDIEDYDEETKLIKILLDLCIDLNIESIEIAFQLIELVLKDFLIKNKSGKCLQAYKERQSEKEQPLELKYRDFFYKFFMQLLSFYSKFKQIFPKLLTNNLLKQLIELLSSEIVVDRDCIKLIIHSIYSICLSKRRRIRIYFYNFIHQFLLHEESSTGISEILEIYKGIIDGLITPIKEENLKLFYELFLPLLKSKRLKDYSGYIYSCLLSFIVKDGKLVVPMIKYMIKYWPIKNPEKSEIFTKILHKIINVTDPIYLNPIAIDFMKLILKLGLDPYIEVFLQAEYIIGLSNFNIFFNLNINAFRSLIPSVLAKYPMDEQYKNFFKAIVKLDKLYFKNFKYLKELINQQDKNYDLNQREILWKEIIEKSKISL